MPVQCAWCKKIKNHDTGEWIMGHATIGGSHGMCPDCRDKMYKELQELKIKKEKGRV